MSVNRPSSLIDEDFGSNASTSFSAGHASYLHLGVNGARAWYLCVLLDSAVYRNNSEGHLLLYSF